MLNFIKKYKTYMIGIALGALAGFLYWRFVGCSSGSCPITSKWYNTMLYGAIMGVLLASPGSKKQKVQSEENN